LQGFHLTANRSESVLSRIAGIFARENADSEELFCKQSSDPIKGCAFRCTELHVYE